MVVEMMKGAKLQWLASYVRDASIKILKNNTGVAK